MTYIVNLSGGLCSFWAAHRTVTAFGRSNVVLLFADTLVEDPALYAFNDACSQLLGIQITRVSRELTPWQLFRLEGMIANNRFPICSTKLKREPLNQWMVSHFELDQHQTNALLPDATVVLGFDWSEAHRVTEFQSEHPTWRLLAPMTQEPIWDKCRMQAEAVNLGLTLPPLYQLGFPHNNCGGRCVRAGISHWIHLLKTLPNRYAEWEEEEQLTIQNLSDRHIHPLTILRDRRGGQVNPMSLRELRQRVESGEQFPQYDWGGCGCGGA